MTKKNLFKDNLQKNLSLLPTPTTISYSWNFGSLLGMTLTIQIFTGLFISMHYSPSLNMAFNCYMNITRDLNQGFILKFSHSTGASMFFILIFTHIFRNLLNKSFKNTQTWMSGFLILLALMMTAFVGYVLPWGQMSLWGATVITNLLSTTPIVGDKLTFWLWGGFSVSEPTLNRFFSIHFLLPLMLTFLALIHMSLLHEMGSSSNMNLNSNKDKIPFSKFFSSKDLTGMLLIILLYSTALNSFNMTMLDPENFTPANPLSTPNHIMPEWYFLFAYAILRSIPSKLGGVLALLSSILILTILPLISKNNSSKFNPLMKTNNFLKLATFISLTYLGSQSIEEPFTLLSKVSSIFYFILMFQCF